MAKIFRYLLFVFGSILGGIAGVWLIRQLHQEIRNRETLYRVVRKIAKNKAFQFGISEARSRELADELVARLAGDGSTDAPLLEDRSKPKGK